MNRIGDKIKKARNNAGLTQKQLAKKLGVSENFINEAESGRKIVNQSIVDRISKVLNININDVNMYFEDMKEEEVKEEKPKVFHEKSEVWNDAFGSILKDVPVYNMNMDKVLSVKKYPIISNKIEGYPQDKVFYIQPDDNKMAGFRIQKGDLVFAHVTGEIGKNGIYIINFEGQNYIRQINRIDSSKVVVISHNERIETKSVLLKDIKVIAEAHKVEFVI